MEKQECIDYLNQRWNYEPRWDGIERPYRAEDVYRLKGSVEIEYTLAERGARKLWNLIQEQSYVHALSAVTGNQAMQEVRAGLKSIYVSGWQVAADANQSGNVYPDMSLYPCDSAPQLVERINNALLRADQVHHMNGEHEVEDWLVPIVADAEAGHGGDPHAYELMRSMIEAGAAGVHFEDQLASQKKCGHMGGKVLVPTREFEQKLTAARLAADVCGVDTVLIARTDADAATLLTDDVDPRDRRFMTGERTREGFYRVEGGTEAAIERARSYAPFADLLWIETSTPDVGEAREIAQAIHEKFPGKPLAYNCSPSFNWQKYLDYPELLTFQEELAELGYVYQFVTLSGFHALNFATFELARRYRERGMAAYSDLQSREFQRESKGYEAIKHQKFAGTGYFDEISRVVSAGSSSTQAMEGSTEAQQFG